MVDLMLLMKSNWRTYSKDIQNDLLMAHFNRAERRKFAKDGNLDKLFKNYCQ